MLLTFPESSVILKYLNEEHANTRDFSYCKEMEIFEIASTTFSGLSLKQEDVFNRVGKIFDEKGRPMPYYRLIESIDLVAAALIDCALRKSK